MKKTYAFAAIAAALTLASCSSSNDGNGDYTPQTISLGAEKSAEVTAYSSSKNNTFDVTRAKSYEEIYDSIMTDSMSRVDEVEVNLTMNNYDEKSVTDKKTGTTTNYNNAGIASHASVHVRSVCDFTLTIPVPAEYFCKTQYSMIVAKHKTDYNMVENKNTFSYNINGNTVTLTITEGEKGITITSSGINESVINYLKATYRDGLTFEVVNYYNSSVKVSDTETKSFTHADLKALLAKSTISFTKNPKNYIQSIGKVSADQTSGVGTEDQNAVLVSLVAADKYQSNGNNKKDKDGKDLADGTMQSTKYFFTLK